METRVNSSGYVIEASGSVPEILNWLSYRLQFEYQIMKFNKFIQVELNSLFYRLW